MTCSHVGKSSVSYKLMVHLNENTEDNMFGMFLCWQQIVIDKSVLLHIYTCFSQRTVYSKA
jgi:hypothetical protein